MDKRAVITGLGLVTPLGVGKDAFARNLFAGQSGVGSITAFDTSRFPSRRGAAVTDFDPRDFIALKNRRRMDRLSQMSAAAARMALEDAGLEVTAANRDRIGVVLGVAFGGTDVAARFVRSIFDEGPNFASPMLVPNTVMNAPAGHSAIELGLRGLNTTVNHREASAETAIAYAAQEIQNGRADVILTGGADIFSEFFFEILTHFNALAPLTEADAGPRPFDLARSGPLIGEGAGILCLESRAHALERGAPLYGGIRGWGMSSAPAPPTDWPDNPRGPVLAMRRAMAAAGLAPTQIDCVSASANGGVRLDRLEAAALSECFQDQDAGPFITSIKGALGESFSSGGIRTAAMALSLRNGVIPPTLGLHHPLQPLNFIQDTRVDTAVQFGLINGFACGGTFISLILQSCSEAATAAGAAA
jgi:3-oxoacyl-[acyl-carrier-protein] synthase II